MRRRMELKSNMRSTNQGKSKLKGVASQRAKQKRKKTMKQRAKMSESRWRKSKRGTRSQRNKNDDEVRQPACRNVIFWTCVGTRNKL